MRNLKMLFVLLFVSMASLTASAQDSPQYKIVGNEVVKVESAKQEPVKTELVHVIKGVEYPVYKSARGKYFIIRTSKNTGKEYKQYLKIE